MDESLCTVWVDGKASKREKELKKRIKSLERQNDILCGVITALKDGFLSFAGGRPTPRSVEELELQYMREKCLSGK